MVRFLPGYGTEGAGISVSGGAARSHVMPITLRSTRNGKARWIGCFDAEINCLTRLKLSDPDMPAPAEKGMHREDL